MAHSSFIIMHANAHTPFFSFVCCSLRLGLQLFIRWSPTFSCWRVIWITLPRFARRTRLCCLRGWHSWWLPIRHELTMATCIGSRKSATLSSSSSSLARKSFLIFLLCDSSEEVFRFLIIFFASYNFHTRQTGGLKEVSRAWKCDTPTLQDSLTIWQETHMWWSLCPTPPSVSPPASTACLLFPDIISIGI